MHWLSPARVGATIVVHEQGFEWASMDVATKFHAPKLSIKNRQHFPALFASLQQHDLATLVTADGSVEYLGVGLRSSAEAERNVDSDRGMRHRSAQRFSYDHPSTTIAVVSDNGPVTIFRNGRAIGLSATGCDLPTPADPRLLAGTSRFTGRLLSVHRMATRRGYQWA